MVTWKEFEKLQPQLAQYGKERFSLKIAYLGTIRRDGTPRIHPVSPILSDERLFIFMEPSSPKGKDLIRNGMYVLHSLVMDSTGSNGEFWLYGKAKKVDDKKLREEAASAANYVPKDRYILFQLDIGEAGSTIYQGGEPIYNHWLIKE
ncbi:MAG: pyridoxamine 5'-phosphate oxidase [Candidatus Thorarchaeota archaeon]